MEENRLSQLPTERVTWGKGDRIVKMSKELHWCSCQVRVDYASFW